MPECSNCGYVNSSNADHCGQCGVDLPKIAPQFNYRQPMKVDNENRPIQLTIVFIINWILIGLLIIGGILGLYFEMQNGLNLILFLFATLILIGSVGIYIWLLISLQEYDNTVRKIFLVLLAISIITSLVSFNVIGLLIPGFVFYVLAFDKRSTDMFY